MSDAVRSWVCRMRQHCAELKLASQHRATSCIQRKEVCDVYYTLYGSCSCDIEPAIRTERSRKQNAGQLGAPYGLPCRAAARQQLEAIQAAMYSYRGERRAEWPASSADGPGSGRPGLAAS